MHISTQHAEGTRGHNQAARPTLRQQRAGRRALAAGATAREVTAAPALQRSTQPGHPAAPPQSGPLPPGVRGGLERQFGHSLSDIRIHAGEAGAQVTRKHAALAVSQGRDLYFGPGAYAPGTARGDQVLRHEVTHYLQRQQPATQRTRPWPPSVLEAEAQTTALARGPVTVRGVAPASQPLAMKTFVSTVGSNPYFEEAVKFYKLWEDETAIRIGSYQAIVDDLATEKTALSAFRIVTHANGQNLFLPLVNDAETYADLTEIGIQTQEALTTRFGALGHPSSDMTSTVHGWLQGTTSGKAILAKLNIKAAPSGIMQEFFWWVGDEYFVTTVKEDAAATGGTPQTTAKEKTALEKEIQLAQAAVKAAATPGLPTSAAATDLDTLRTEILAAFKAQSWTWGKVPAGYLKERLDRMQHKTVVAFRKAVQAGTFEQNLTATKSRVSDKTHIEIRGCNIGKSDAFLNGIREFFGTKPDKLPSISAPMLYQFFGTPGALVIPQGAKQPPVADSLKFLFEETFDDTSVAKDVEEAVKNARLTTVGGLADVLRFADVKADFEAWWKMKQKAKGVADADIKSATLKDFQDFLTTGAKSFPVNAPGVGATSLWYLILLPSSAIETMLNWVKDQGYTLPGGKDPLDTFFGGKKTWNASRFTTGQEKIKVDWMGDNYPVPDKIFFPEDPEYKKNIRRLP